MTVKEKTMTVKEVADYLNVNEITVRRLIKKIMPEKLKPGVKTELTKDDVTMIIRERQLDSRGVEDNTIQVLTFMKQMQDQQNEFMKMMLDEIKQIKTDVKQIEYKDHRKEIETQKQMTVAQYIKEYNIKVYNPKGFAIKVGKKCTKFSTDYCRPINSKFNGQYPERYYDIDVIKSCINITLIEEQEIKDLFDN